MAQYACLRELGWLTDHDIEHYFGDGTKLKGLSDAHVPGLEVSSGSLGHGLSVGVGLAMAAKRKGTGRRVYAIVGDGEANEGPIWEALLFASHFKLSNLITIIDANGFQAMGTTREVMDMGRIADKLTAFGLETREVDGHDEDALDYALMELASLPGDRPRGLVAHTVKGKGVSFMEGDNRWHYTRLSDDTYRAALAELNGRGGWSMRNAFSAALVNAARKDPRVLLLTGDHGYALFDEIRRVCPDQYVNAGVAEQNMVGVAAGLAKGGFRPVVYGLSAFVPVRVLEQIKMDVCYESLPVIFIGDGAGVVYSTLGHQPSEYGRRGGPARRSATVDPVAGRRGGDDGGDGAGLRRRRAGLPAHGQIRPGRPSMRRYPICNGAECSAYRTAAGRWFGWRPARWCGRPWPPRATGRAAPSGASRASSRWTPNTSRRCAAGMRGSWCWKSIRFTAVSARPSPNAPRRTARRGCAASACATASRATAEATTT